VSLAGFIAAQRVEHGIPCATSCHAVGVSQAWFYKWVHGDVSLRRTRREALAAQIKYLFTKHKRRYGSPRITVDLQALGWRVSKNTVAELMRELGLVARPKRRRGTTKADRSARKAPDLVGRDFSLRDRPNQVWVGDLTDIPNEEGPLYLGSVLDLHSRRVVGFGMDAHHDAELARGARCAWRSRSAAGRLPGWCSTPTRAVSTPGSCSPPRAHMLG
jgi:putative transposase